MKRTATLTQAKSNLAYQEANPLLLINRSKQRKRSFDAATEYFKKYKNPLTRTLQDIFGTKFFARAALWLDPLADFRNSSGIISYATRYRSRPPLTHNGTIYEKWNYTEKWNYIVNEFEQLVLSSDNIVDQASDQQVMTNDLVTAYATSTMADSTRKSRSFDSSWASGDTYDQNIPSFGTMEMYKYSSVTSGSPNVVFRQDVYQRYPYSDAAGYLPYLRTYTDRYTLSVDGSCTSPSGPLFLSDIDAYAITFMNDNVSGMIVNALANKRAFTGYYQLWELRELPRLIGNIQALRSLIKKAMDSPQKLLTTLDKEISSLYLAWSFGVKPTVAAIQDLMQLPQRATKRLNYLIRRNGKATTGRSLRRWLNERSDEGLPTFTFHLPDWVVVQDEEVKRSFRIELRCVVNQTIAFPELAEPTLSDKDFRDLVGATPTIEDAYNFIPFSWLVDYFGGLGDYVSLMTAIHSDRQLVNYGFLTIVINEELIHTANLKVESTRVVEFSDEFGTHPISDDTYVQSFPYRRVYTRKYQQRVDIGSLEGVKSFGFFQTNLNEFQASILGALISQRL